jgi:hypothetical protein
MENPGLDIAGIESSASISITSKSGSDGVILGESSDDEIEESDEDVDDDEDGDDDDDDDEDDDADDGDLE